MKPEDSLKLQIEVWLSKQGVLTPFSLKKLAGDGSTRSFYRLTADFKNWVVLYDPEWKLSKDYPSHQSFLKTHHIPVPEFPYVDPSLGILIMEDLGDVLLQSRILSHPKEKEGWIEKATVLLAELHGKTFPVPRDLPASQRFFDTEKYSEELQFTLNHLNHQLLGLPEFTGLNRIQVFCHEIASIKPLVFSHRDYHTRNILLHQGKLVLIDFQDARLGSPHYDLASLLYDPYVPITDENRKALLKTYQQTLSLHSVNQKINWKSFDSDLKKVAIQRVVKAAGSFASFFTRYGKKTHLPYLLPALNSAQALCSELQLDNLFPLENWMSEITKKNIE